MDLDNIFQTLLSQERDFENENGYSDLCIENPRENGDGPELPMDPSNLLHDMDSAINRKQDIHIKDEEIIDLDEFKDILGDFDDNAMLIHEDLPTNDDNIEKDDVDSSIEIALFDSDHSDTLCVHSDFQKKAAPANNDLLSNDIVFINNDGKIEIEIKPSTKDHGVKAQTHQSNTNNSSGSTLPSFQEAFRMFCGVPFNTFTQVKAREHNVQYENEGKSHKEKGNEFQITTIDVTDDSDDDIALVEDQTEYYDSILTQNLKFVDNLTTSDVTMVEQEAADPTESDTDCDGYHSSDFEFITESEAEACGIVVNARNNLTQRTRKNKARALNDYQNLAEDNVLDDDMFCEPSQGNESNETAHKIPEGEDYFNLFRGEHAPIMPVHYMMENKSAGVRSCMAVDDEGIGFNMGAAWRDDNDDDELKADAERTLRKIFHMYPFENYRRQRRY